MKAILRPDGRYVVFVPKRLSRSGKREGQYFRSEADAKEFAAGFQEEREEFGRLALTPTERYYVALAKAELGDLSQLPEAIRHFKQTAGSYITRTDVKDAVARFVKARLPDVSRRTASDVRWRLDRFAEVFAGRGMHELSAGDIENFLGDYSGWSRRSFFKRLRPFFDYAVRHRWVAENPVSLLKPPDVPSAKKAVYTASQLTDLLYHASFSHEDMIPVIALSAFAFLRAAELIRLYADEDVLRWEDIGHDRIHVRETVGKSTRRAVGNERFVPVSMTLRYWLDPVRRKDGLVVPWLHSEFSKRWRKFCADMKVTPINNGLRRSAISHALAGDPALSVGQVARWAGSSEATVKKHYLELLTEKEGKDWFEVTRPY